MALKVNLKIICFFFIVSHLLFMQTFLQAQANGCIACHKELEDELLEPVQASELDIHKRAGLGCQDCHGGNPEEEDIDLSKDETFKGVPERKHIPEFCASCHSDASYMRSFNPSLRIDQLTLYWTSEHGQLLRKGDDKVAVCTDCHGIHSMETSSHPRSWTFPWNIPEMCSRCHSNEDYMKGYNIPTDQDENYRQSVHAYALFDKKDLSAPVCNDCHGNHGAAPPEVTSIAFVCHQCHPSAADLFAQSPHKEAYDEMGIAECEACHGNHKIIAPSDEMLGTGDKAVCIQCHEKDSQAYLVAAQMKQRIQDLDERLKKADVLLSTAYSRGVEVSESRFKLREATTLLVMIRNLTHSFSLDAIEEKFNEGEKITAEITEEGEAALREARLRRTGLVIATFFVIALALALFLKVRLMKKKTLA